MNENSRARLIPGARSRRELADGDGTVRCVLQDLCSSSFHSLSRYPVLSPASAVIRRSFASAYKPSVLTPAISIKLRTKQLTKAKAKLARKEFNVLADGGIRLVPVSRVAFKQAAGMVKPHRFGLRAGDSLHLAVALELGAKHMATLDGTLAKSAQRKGLKRIVL